MFFLFFNKKKTNFRQRFEEYFKKAIIIKVVHIFAFYSVLDKSFEVKDLRVIENSAFLATLGRNDDRPFTIATNSTGPRRCATRVAVLIVCRMIHGALWYGDHPRNILSSRYQPQASGAYPPPPRRAEAEGHWLETTCRDTANEGYYAALLSTLQI